MSKSSEGPSEEDISKCLVQMVARVRHYAIFLVDANGIIRTWNSAAEAMKGYAPEEVLGKHLRVLYPDDKRQEGVPEENLATAAEKGTFEDESWRKKKDGTLFWAQVELVALQDGDGELMGFCKITRDRTGYLELTNALKDKDRHKDEFLAMLAHELRNPLAPIRAAADILTRCPDDPERVRPAGSAIARQVKHLTALVNDLLDVSRVSQGLVRIDKKQVDLKRVLSHAVEQTRPLLEAREHRLRIHTAAGDAHVNGDEKRLVQVVANVLTNAAKFTDPRGSIGVSLEDEGEFLALTVSDNGIGMSQETVQRAFELFAQATRTPDRAQGGLGIGLSLVKRLVELHGGSVAASSGGLGCGSEFLIRLPRAAATGSAPEVMSEPVQRGFRSLRVLVVDDNEDAGTMLGMLLEGFGHQVMMERDPLQALARAAAEHPDVCLLDIGMPHMDGNELARRLRHDPSTADITLVAVTGYGRTDDRRQTSEAGFDHHLVKPIDHAALIDLLSTVDMRSI